jgi:hypothetical protein
MADKLSPMQQELLRRADSIFDAISTTVGQAKDLAVEQLPDIAYQYIAFSRAYLTFIMLGVVTAMIAIQVVTITFGNRSCKRNSSYSKDVWDFDQWAPWIMVTAVSTTLFGGIFLANVKDFFMVWFAPKVFLIEHLVHLVKG